MTSEKRFKKVYLEIGNVCNLSCSFCPGTKRKPKQMSAEEFTFAAKKLRDYTDYLYFHLMGEPLLHSQLAQLLDIAAELGYKVIITTNGTLLEEKGNILLESVGVHKVNISLQSFEANENSGFAEYMASCIDFADHMSRAGKLRARAICGYTGQVEIQISP